MMLDKKQVLVIFLFEFKMDRKAVEIAHNINNTLCPGTDNTCDKCSGGSGSSAKQTRGLKMRSIVADHQRLAMTN